MDKIEPAGGVPCGERAFSEELGKMLPEFIDRIEVGLYISDYHTGEILFVNQKFASYSKNTREEIIGNLCWNYVNPEGNGRCSFCPYEKLIDAEGRPLPPYTWEFYLDSVGMWLKSINQALFLPNGRLAHMVTFYDITEVKRTQERLARLAYTDQLLHLKNDLKLESDILESLTAPSLIIFDILSLQKINEAYGRKTGDNLLKAIRDWIFEQNIPTLDLYRIGGDEFCITIGQASEKEVSEFADALLRRFLEPWTLDNGGCLIPVFSAASVGVIHCDYVQTGLSLLNVIERTLLSAKENGKVIVYNKKMDAEFDRRLQLELSLKQSVRDGMDGFEVYYQPITDSSAKAWHGLEALCRWNSKELGSVSPLTFIAEAERLSLIGTIGLWVLETSICQCKKWNLDRCKDFVLNVNVSAVQFLDDALASKILGILQKYDFPCTNLCLEITESMQFIFNEQSLNTVGVLRDNNVLVALDDFGTGYSNFNTLKNLPINIVKIERDFVSDIESNSYHQYLFHAMVELAHTADLKLVAEGVETKEQRDILLKNGADYLQGFLFSRPLPSDRIEGLLGQYFEIE